MAPPLPDATIDKGNFHAKRMDCVLDLRQASGERPPRASKGRKSEEETEMILCAGEALIDMLPRKTEGGEAAFAPYPGGAVFNTAIALARLEVPVSFFSGLSDDLFGDRLAAS
jgi:hypothetical protein